MGGMGEVFCQAPSSSPATPLSASGQGLEKPVLLREWVCCEESGWHEWVAVRVQEQKF